MANRLHVEFILEDLVILGNGRRERNGHIAEFGFHVPHRKESEGMSVMAT